MKTMRISIPVKFILLLTALLLAPFVANAQQTTSPDTVRDRLWLFGVPAGGPRLYYEGAGYRGGSRMTLAEGAFWLGVPNLMFITQPWNQPPAMSREKGWKSMTTKEQYAISFQPLKRVQWAAVGSGGLGGLAEVPDLVILGLAGIDQGIPSAPWMRDWIKQHGDEKLTRQQIVTIMKHRLILLSSLPGSWAEVHAAGSSWRRRTHAV